MTTIFHATSNFLLDSGVFTIFVSRARDSLVKASIWEVYSIKKTLFLKLLPFSPSVPHFQASSDLREDHYFDLELDNKVGRRGDFGGITLLASAKDDQSGWAVVERIEGKMRLVGGGGSPWFRDLATMLNFSMEVIFGDSIITLKNNSLAGKTLEQLNSGEADLSLITSLVVDFRAKSLTFLQPFYSTLIYVFFRQPTANSIRNIVTAPFHPLLWATLISTWLLLIVLVKLGQWIQTIVAHPLHHTPQETSRRSKDSLFAANVGLWAIAATCQKSWYFVPGSTPLKLTFLCGSLCGVLIYGAYSAAVVSTLATHSIPVERFPDLITHGFTLTVHNQSEPFHLILKDLIKLWGLRQEVEKVSTEHEISHLLHPTNPKAFLSYQDLFHQTSLALGYSDRFICNTLSKVQLSDFRYKTAMFLKKGSEYREIFNHKILVILERGFNHRYVQHYDRGNILACETDREKGHVDVEPLDFHDTFTPFLVILMGHLMAFGFLLWERICHSCQASRPISKSLTDHERNDRYRLS